MPTWKNQYINPNKFSRPQEKLKAVRKLVVHWTANYGATAQNHYKYFNNLKDRYASAHIFVDKNEAICIIPLNEVAYHANDGTYRGVPELKPNANYLSIGVEMCVEKDGSFHKDTIERTENVFVELCKMFNLNPLKDIVRHYDVTRKSCPTPWVRNPQEFENFKKRVNEKLNGGLTVSQYQELKNLIQKQQNEIEELRKQLNNKLDKTPEREVLDTHKEGYDFVVKNKISNGKNPQNYLTREQMFTLLKNYHDKFNK